MRDWCSTVHHDDQCSFAPEEVGKELKEGVEGEGFIDVSEGIEVECSCERHNRSPRGSRVDGHHEQNSNHVSLEERLAVV